MCEGNKRQAAALESVLLYRWMYFLLKLQEKLGNGFECFDALDSLGKSSFI